MMEFVKLKLGRKQPALRYLLEDAISQVQGVAIAQIDRINAELFRERHRYMQLVVQREPLPEPAKARSDYVSSR